MKKQYLLLSSFLLFFTSFSSFAQKGWTVYNKNNTPVLSSGVYTSISIDQTGNIWAGGSYTNLFSFNGSSWKAYTTFNSNLLHEDINAILTDNSNKVWVATYKGISVFNGTNFTNYDTINAGFKGMTVYALGKDRNGKIWLSSKNGSFGYKGITTFDGTTWTNLTGYPTQVVNEEIPGFAFTSSNVAWIACQNGVVKNNGTFTFYPEAATGLWSSSVVAIDAAANVWFGGFDGLLKYDGSDWTFYGSVADFGFTSNTFYNDIYPDGNILWVASSAGLLKFDRTTGKVLVNYNSSNSPLADNGVSKIAKDVSGNLWLATTVGIVKMNPSQVGIEEYKNSHPVTVYPNPSNETFHFSTSGNPHLSYKVYAVDGTLVNAGETTSSTFKLNLETAAAGIYYMHISGDDAADQVIKLIKY